MEELVVLERKALEELHGCGDEPGLRAWNARYLGDKGEVKRAFERIRTLPKDQKPAFGQKANDVKQRLTKEYEEALKAQKERDLRRSLAEESVDVTLPGRPVVRGRLH